MGVAVVLGKRCWWAWGVKGAVSLLAGHECRAPWALPRATIGRTFGAEESSSITINILNQVPFITVLKLCEFSGVVEADSNTYPQPAEIRPFASVSRSEGVRARLPV
jgi:hypothetical protein